MKKSVGFIGLGKMGTAMVEHMLEEGIEVICYNRSPEKVAEIAAKGAIPSYTYEEFIQKLRGAENRRCIIWLMVKSGSPVDEVLFGNAAENMFLLPYLEKGDIIIDGGNSHYQDSKKRAEIMYDKQVSFLDCGTSGGILGARHGACLMIGGDEKIYREIKWLFEILALPKGEKLVGPVGAGHYVKMVHNAIEYGMMQSIAEGMDLLENGAKESLGAKLNLEQVLDVWNHGSIIDSYLTHVTQQALQKDPHLEKIEAFVEDNGEGAWTIMEAIKANVPFLTVCHALFMRYTTRQENSFAMKIVAAQRNEFGGHNVKYSEK